MELESLALQAGAACGHDHRVEFYETEAFLVDTVCDFLAPALRGGDSAIVVATAAHRDRFRAALGAAGIDVDAAESEARYQAFEAADVLAQFMVDGAPDVTLFRETIGAVMDRASRGGRRIRVYGEMVALLWADGDAASALALEDLWNELAQLRAFLLLCAYPMQGFDDPASRAAFQRICEQHTTVIPAESYSLLAGPAERSRAVALLQQERASLRAEVLALRAGSEPHRATAMHDQAADERDQAAGQRDEAAVQRDSAGSRGDRAADQRDEAGGQRDEAGDERDEAAERRDEAADQRDHAAERAEGSAATGLATQDPSPSAVARREAASDRRKASNDRRAGVRQRAAAGLDRGTALADRQAGAGRRTEAELDRDTALADRGASAREREDSAHDALTGAHLRGAGYLELERKMALARRSGQPLVVAFADVDGLKAVNDALGHAAGDRMLLGIADALRAQLRSSDLIIRYGGDEFLCAVAGLSLADAADRFAEVDTVLAQGAERGSVTVGLAELRSGDSVDELVARADAALYRKRGR